MLGKNQVSCGRSLGEDRSLPATLFARYPVSRQTLVVLIDTAVISLPLSFALILRETRLPAEDHLFDRKRTSFVGSLLHRTRLDEVLQLWKALIGDTAIIGLRPLFAVDLDALADQGRACSSARSGILGWAQVIGGQQLDADEKHIYHRWYVEHTSRALDLPLIGRAISKMLLGARRDYSANDFGRAALMPEAVGVAE